MIDWKKKLAAYLHDPPSKFADIALHEDHAETLYRQAGFVEENELRSLSNTYAKPSDWIASSADRLPFPTSRKLSSKFDGVEAKFHHPLSGELEIGFHKPFQASDVAKEVDQPIQPCASVDSWEPKEQWRARFFAHWRLWEKFCVEKDCRFAFLPADTRIPDHTIWTHMQVVSALDGCSSGSGKDAVLTPAFLKFQLGPVQEFIAEARSIRDLWSGSYLLSWLMAAGLKALALEIGPDAVVFPNLKGQPLFDLHLRDCLYSQLIVNEKSVWEHLGYDKKPEGAFNHRFPEYLTPNLPNVFLAVVPAERSAELGKLVSDAIQTEWEKIASAVWDFCDEEKMIPDLEAGFSKEERRKRYDRQVNSHLSLSWQATPWPKDLAEALEVAKSFGQDLPIQEAAKRVREIVEFATKTMPEKDRDSRYYVDHKTGENCQLNNIGLGWSIILALNSWQLDAVRQTRAFDAWNSGGWETGTFCNKDTLGGKAEAVAGGREWGERAEKKGDTWKTLFKHKGDWLGAVTLIKRVWYLAVLKKQWGLPVEPHEFKMPNTHGIAGHEPFSDSTVEDMEEKYFAVLALDGDEIGKWVSGAKTPALEKQLSHYGNSGALNYFKENGGDSLLKSNRPLSPSYHLQFSQALSNFALRCARRVVEAFDGRLIYAGGDDVLAMLPADTAIECAQALRNAFQGRSVERAGLFQAQPGFLFDGLKDYQEEFIPFLVPGPNADCSVGIAIAHCKAPLQDVVRAAQRAEKRAKNANPNGLGRSAVAVSLFKRSGEILEWGAKWDSRGLELYDLILQHLGNGELSGKFPHRVVELLAPYLLKQTEFARLEPTPEFDANQIIECEFQHALSRQTPLRGAAQVKMAAALSEKLCNYLNNIPNERDARIQSMIGLCQTVAFAHRTQPASQNA